MGYKGLIALSECKYCGLNHKKIKEIKVREDKWQCPKCKKWNKIK